MTTAVDTGDPRFQDKPPNELAQICRDLRRDVRELEKLVAAEDRGGVGEMTQRFGSGDPIHHQSASQQRKRLERLKADIAYLDSLLQVADPILAAQASAS